MNSVPVGRRTRLQQAIKDKELRDEKKRRWFAARSNWRKKLRLRENANVGVVNDSTDEEAIDVLVQRNRKSDEDGRNDEDSDDSLQIVGERWNPDDGYESHSSETNSDSGDDSDEQVVVGSLYGGKDGKDEANEKDDDHISFCSDVDNRVKSEEEHDMKRRKRVSNAGVFRRFDGLVLPKEPENNARQSDFVSRRTRSRLKPKLLSKKRGDGTFSCPVVIDDESSSSSFGHKDNGHETQNNHMAEDTKSREIASSRKRHRPRRTTYVTNESKIENDKGGENVVKRKRGRPRKNKNPEEVSRVAQKRRKLTTNEFENIMLNTFSENGSGGLETLVSSVSEAYLPLKFNFRIQNLLPEKSDEEEKIEALFNNLEFALRGCDVGFSISGLDEDEDADNVPLYESVVVQAKLCRQGKHYLILEDEIGIMCKFCPFVKLEIRDVTPDFDDNPFRKSENQNNRWIPYNEYDPGISDGFHLPGFSHDPEHVHSDDIPGTVWDLIQGIKSSLYPHQQEAFEFIWKNVGGSLKLTELGKPARFRIRGCIICHAPGMGKIRLAITFLESFIKKYPMSKPVIVSPRSMLLTWEEEIAWWNVDVAFHNMNKTELLGREDTEVLKYAENVKNINKTRMAKLCSWEKGKGILGISYRLFEKLAGEKGTGRIKRVLLEGPGIMVLDKGHTPRNNDRNIWNVLTKVETKRQIILSGTPFQNNFEELCNTLSLVREEFKNPLLLGNFETRAERPISGFVDNNNRRILELRKLMKPFVHVHKGEILEKTLRGLFHSVLFLNPSDLQKMCCQQLWGLKYIMELNHLVSVTCVHPSVLAGCNHVPEIIDKVLLTKHKADLEVGSKIKFLFELISLAVGEKILVFSQYLPPLNFIADLLSSGYNWKDGKEFLYMKGQQDAKQRQTFINMFNDPSSEVRVLLASTKACGEGIHLVGASRVVLLDVVWNPSVERQAISRAYRIGQRKDVFVYLLISSGTMEEEKYYRLVNKDCLSDLVFSSEGESDQKTRMVSRVFSEDRVLEEMIRNEKTNGMFSKIVCESKADELIKSFNSVNV
ncbi:hypothetical protein RND81_13G021600 [Saponaria officinalis]|uniref:Uncharacterized protein n=1 Tax=Saponaria officinalis TaxID=3572 RepID=A0AAW1GZL1_SAPOF